MTKYSDKELAMFSALGMNREPLYLSPNMLYPAAIARVFVEGQQGPAVESLRRCEQARLEMKPTRWTPEYDALIDLETHPPDPPGDWIVVRVSRFRFMLAASTIHDEGPNVYSLYGERLTREQALLELEKRLNSNGSSSEK